MLARPHWRRPFGFAVVPDDAEAQPAGRAQHNVPVRLADDRCAQSLGMSSGRRYVVGVHVQVAARRAVLQPLDTQVCVPLRWP